MQESEIMSLPFLNILQGSKKSKLRVTVSNNTNIRGAVNPEFTNIPAVNVSFEAGKSKKVKFNRLTLIFHLISTTFYSVSKEKHTVLYVLKGNEDTTQIVVPKALGMSSEMVEERKKREEVRRKKAEKERKKQQALQAQKRVGGRLGCTTWDLTRVHQHHLIQLTGGARGKAGARKASLPFAPFTLHATSRQFISNSCWL